MHFKDILPKRNFFKVFFECYIHQLTYQNTALFGRLKQYFTCFDCSIILCAILLSCGIACPIIHAETGVAASARVLGRINK